MSSESAIARADRLRRVPMPRRFVVSVIAGLLHAALCVGVVFGAAALAVWIAPPGDDSYTRAGSVYLFSLAMFVGLPLVPFVWAFGVHVMCRVARTQGGSPAWRALGVQIVAYVASLLCVGIAFEAGSPAAGVVAVLVAATLLPGVSTWIALTDPRWLRRIVG